MNEKIKQKYKDLFITLIEEEDWSGARNLLDSVINQAALSQTPIILPSNTEILPAPEPPQPTSFDDERMMRFNEKEAERDRKL